MFLDFTYSGVSYLGFDYSDPNQIDEFLSTVPDPVSARFALDLAYCHSMRLSEYHSLNQFEMQYNDSINGTTTWKDAIDAIKLKYPKPINVEEKEV